MELLVELPAYGDTGVGGVMVCATAAAQQQQQQQQQGHFVAPQLLVGVAYAVAAREPESEWTRDAAVRG